jgi:hypothetical protein
MSTAKRISVIGGYHLLVALVLAAAAVAAVAPSAKADPPSRVTVTGGADIHVWLDQPWDIYPSYGDVVVSVQAGRGCYATVFVVDTFGYVHVIHPFSPFESAWMSGGVTYRFSGRELGLDRFGGRGIVHVFAMASPYPFDFSPYGRWVFAGRYGYRIYGDPYVACRQFYVTLLPAAHHWDRVAIASARFYVREWVRYPVYLCHHHRHGAAYVRVTSRCYHCNPVYDTYRVHVNDPQVVLRRAPRYKDTHAQSYAQTRIKRSTRGDIVDRPTTVKDRKKVAARSTARKGKIVSSKRSGSVTVKRASAAKQSRQGYAARKQATKQSSTSLARANKSRAAKTKTNIQKGRVSR